jgi:hypothetical protein
MSDTGWQVRWEETEGGKGAVHNNSFQKKLLRKNRAAEQYMFTGRESQFSQKTSLSRSGAKKVRKSRVLPALDVVSKV